MKIGIINEGEDFIFQLTTQEVEELSRCKNFTLNRGTDEGVILSTILVPLLNRGFICL